MGLFFQEITFITELPGSNFLPPRFLTGGKWDFQVANLLLLISDLGFSLVMASWSVIKVYLSCSLLRHDFNVILAMSKIK